MKKLMVLSLAALVAALCAGCAGFADIASPPDPDGIEVSFHTEPDFVMAGLPATLVVSITGADGKPLQGIEKSNGYYVHFNLVSEDLYHNFHLHADQNDLENGVFKVELDREPAATYSVTVDFVYDGKKRHKLFRLVTMGIGGGFPPRY